MVLSPTPIFCSQYRCHPTLDWVGRFIEKVGALGHSMTISLPTYMQRVDISRGSAPHAWLHEPKLTVLLLKLLFSVNNTFVTAASGALVVAGVGNVLSVNTFLPNREIVF